MLTDIGERGYGYLAHFRYVSLACPSLEERGKRKRKDINVENARGVVRHERNFVGRRRPRQPTFEEC